VGLRHYGRKTAGSYAPSASAVAGALAIYLEGRRHDDARQMLFGLSILRSATAEQVDTARAMSNATLGAEASTAPAAPAIIFL
jgi:hypothetical protein